MSEETPEQREKRLKRQREYSARPENKARAKKLRQMRRAVFTEAEKEDIRNFNRLKAQAIRDAETPEEREERLKKQRIATKKARLKRLANETLEEREERRRKKREWQRRRREEQKAK